MQISQCPISNQKVPGEQRREKNIIHKKQKNPSIKTYPKQTQILELADIKSIITNIFNLFKKLSRKMERDISKKTHIQLLEIKISMCEVENSLDGINGRADIIGEKNLLT